MELMTAENFAYWLKGYFEISNAISLTEDQVKTVKQHLDYVFNTPVVVPSEIPVTDTGSSGGAIYEALKTMPRSIDTRTVFC